MQINIVESAEYCDFIVWKENDIYIERIVPDEDFWDQIVHKAETFFRQCILPQVFATSSPNQLMYFQNQMYSNTILTNWY